MSDHHPEPGILAIWNDCAPGREDQFEFWMQSEHLAERLAVPGFRVGRRHEAVSGSPRFFVCYETDSPDVLTSKAYLDRVNEPTPLTRTIMAEVFRNMNRTVCRLAHRMGAMRGAFLVTVRFQDTPDVDALERLLGEFCNDPGIASGEIWLSTETGPREQSAEEVLRGGDARIAACLAVATLRPGDAERVKGTLAGRIGDTENIGVYHFLCEHRGGDADR